MQSNGTHLYEISAQSEQRSAADEFAVQFRNHELVDLAGQCLPGTGEHNTALSVFLYH
ncbi:hypothetical protein D3C75_1273600 [compost metagenome]